MSQYDDFYKAFESPIMRKVRSEAYGEDIGQHSWVSVDELRRDIALHGLSPASRLLDLGCGPGGPLTFAIGQVGCRGVGAEVSSAAIAAARARAISLGLEQSTAFHRCDLNERLPFADGSFDVVISFDVVLHLRDREALFREVTRVLANGGKFLFTDAGILTGPVSDEEFQLRSVHGYTQFVPPGFNERALEAAGFKVVGTEDRTASTLAVAAGRLGARIAHRSELEPLEGGAGFERQQRYLQTVVSLSRRRAITRMMLLSESWRGPGPSRAPAVR
jgi:SAM-dependent methyltransferase